MNDEQVLHLMELAYKAGNESYLELCKPTCIKILTDFPDGKSIAERGRYDFIDIGPKKVQVCSIVRLSRTFYCQCSDYFLYYMSAIPNPDKKVQDFKLILDKKKNYIDVLHNRFILFSNPNNHPITINFFYE